MRLDVVYEPTATGWSAYPAEVSGVGVTAPDRPAARELLCNAIASHLDIPRAEIELREFVARIEQVDNGYVAFLLPHVAGCWIQASTPEEAQDSLADAIEQGCLRTQSANMTLYPSSAAIVTSLSRGRVPA
jgi:hypothetical protein